MDWLTWIVAIIALGLGISSFAADLNHESRLRVLEKPAVCGRV